MAATTPAGTESGVILGTVGYMAPEQVRGQPCDHRADIFALGCVLYEMLSGQRAFQGATPADTLSAILTKDPPDLAGSQVAVSPSLERVVRRCLEKEASQRFETAHDVAFALEVASAASGRSAVTAPPMTPVRPMRKAALVALASVLLAVSWAGVFQWTKQTVRAPVPAFKRITMRRGAVELGSLHARSAVGRLQCVVGREAGRALRAAARLG